MLFPTNNQTNVNVTALRATEKTQQDIEDVLKLHGIYYARRPNYYQNQGIPEKLIISPLALASAYISLLYKNPYKATSLKQKFMRDDKKYEQVFSPTSDLNVWYPLAYLYQKTDDILTDLKPYVGSKAARFLKNYRQIIMFLTVSRLIGTFAFGEKQLISFDLSKYSKDEVQKSINDLKEVNPDCFNTVKKLSAAFYTLCFNHAATKHNIAAIQAIRAKNRELWSGEDLLSAYSLTENRIESVFNKLPQQPWPVKIHRYIANELHLSEMAVSNAIGYMIYTGRLNHQVYGFVFDKDENVIAEGNHFGHTEEEARTKLIEQKKMYEKKYGIDAF